MLCDELFLYKFWILLLLRNIAYSSLYFYHSLFKNTLTIHDMIKIMKGYMTFPNTGSDLVSFFTANFASNTFFYTCFKCINGHNWQFCFCRLTASFVVSKIMQWFKIVNWKRGIVTLLTIQQIVILYTLFSNMRIT
jgi:hypothetical protein